MSLADNLARVRDQLATACLRAHRPASDVQLMAVSKTHPVASIHEAYAVGQRLFGENRVQEMQGKAPELTAFPDLDIHLIGPLQNNKTGKAAELFHAVDTLDSAKTAIRLNDAAAAQGKTLPILIEVKLSNEPSKHGVAPNELEALLEALAPLTRLRPSGLMTVPPSDTPGDKARPYFRQLRALRDHHQQHTPTLTELSMGMSSDFEAAIEEGATTIRIGTALFGQREAK